MRIVHHPGPDLNQREDLHGARWLVIEAEALTASERDGLIRWLMFCELDGTLVALDLRGVTDGFELQARSTHLLITDGAEGEEIEIRTANGIPCVAVQGASGWSCIGPMGPSAGEGRIDVLDLLW